MSISHSAACWAAPVAFLIDFAAQIYGILATPNMKDIHDANISFWSPHPYLIAAFFFPQQILQAVWLFRLCKLDPKRSEKEKQEVGIMLKYLPFYVLGNLCLATWVLFWNASSLKLSNAFVLLNTLSQFTYLLRQPRMSTTSKSSILTHILSKTFAGLSVIDLLHNSSVAYFDHQGPNTFVKVLTGVGFAAMASMSDWIFGACLVYDLLALAVGQTGVGEASWGRLLGGYALGTALIVGMRNWTWPPYLEGNTGGYEYVTEDGA